MASIRVEEFRDGKTRTRVVKVGEMDWTDHAEPPLSESEPPPTQGSVALVGSTDYRTAPKRIRVVRSRVKKWVPRKHSDRLIRASFVLAVASNTLTGVLQLFRPFEVLALLWFFAAAGFLLALRLQYERKLVEVEKEIVE